MRLALALTYWVYQRVPKGFIPNEDAGYFIVAVQAPEGGSLEYTTNILGQAEAAMSKIPEIESAFSVAGFSFGGSAPNRALDFCFVEGLRAATGREPTLPTT